MNKITIAAGLLFLVMFLTSACVVGDPYAVRSAADGAIQATEAARSEKVQAATLEAARIERDKQATIGAMQAQASATVDAFNLMATQGAATASAIESQTTATQSAIGTSTAWPATQISTSATQSAILREQAQKDQEARWQAFLTPIKEIAPVVFWLVTAFLLFLAFIQAWRRFAPVLELRLRSFRRGDDSPLAIYPDLVIEPRNMTGPALRLGDGRQVESAGYSPDPKFQEATTMRAQLIQAIRVLPRGGPQQAARVAQIAQRATPPTRPMLPTIEVVNHEEGEIAAWVGEVEHKLEEKL